MASLSNHMITFHIFTIFPNIFSSYFNESILKRAQKKKIIKIKIYNIRDFADDKHKTAAPACATRKRCGRVDDRPYGGGAGMVMKIEPIIKAIKSITKFNPPTSGQNSKVILFSARGKQFNQKIARDSAKKYKDIILICGHYEGVDERLKKAIHDLSFKVQEISIGPYILSGGEAAATVVVDAISRHIPGVLGKIESLEEKKGSYPAYTRPEIFSAKGGSASGGKYKVREYRVPKVLLSGKHKKINEWRLKRGRKMK